MSPRAFLWFCTTIFSTTVVLINGQSNQPTLPIRGSTEQTSVSPWMGTNVTETPTTSALSRIPLYLAVLVSFGAVDTSGSFVASDLALKHINEREDVLPGYELRMSLSNSACDDGTAIKALFDLIFREPQKIMIVGPSCSTAAQAIASTAKFWNLNVMSPTASSPALHNRNKYSTFGRIIPSDTSLNPSRVALMKLFNWTRVATIHENHEVFSLSVDDLLNHLKDSNITIISSESFDDDPKNQVENLKKQDAKIIAGNMYYPTARQMFCEAYKHGMYGEGYVWLLLGEYKKDWYKEDDDTLSCSKEELLEAVETSMYIGTQAPVLGKEESVTVAGITPLDYLRLIEEHLQLFDSYALTNQASYGYDAIWVVAIALNKTINILNEKRLEDGITKKLEEFTFDDSDIAKIILDAINSVHFEGVSGPISFHNGERIGLINLEQLRGECEDGWLIYGRYCYKFILEEKSLEDAISYCNSLQGHLIDVRNEKEYEALKKMEMQEHMVGATQWLLSLQRDTAGTFQWTDGPVAITPGWAPWEDEDGSLISGDGPCFVMDLSRDQWESVPCTSFQAFMCKKGAEFSQVIFARHDIAKGEIEWLSDIIWPGDQVPLDHTPQITFTLVESYQSIPLLVYVIMCSLAGVGILLALVFLIFNIYFRQQKFMKMSSPNLNNLILIGSILIYTSTCLSGWDSPNISKSLFRILCQTRVWVFSVGFVLSFGSMFSKTWRVHKVAALKNPKRVIITDRHLFVMVAMLLLVDVVILAAWFIINPIIVQRQNHYRMEDRELQIILQPYILFCASDNDLYWQAALYGYKGLLLIFGTFLAWETRKVTIPALNDSKLIGLCVYNVILLSAIGVGVNLAVATDTAVSFVFTSAIQTFCTTVTLIVIFVPKILSVYKYPEGKPVTTMTTNITNFSTNDASNKKDDEIEDLQLQIKELKKKTTGRDQAHSGCGFWCGALLCAFCDDDDYESDIEGGVAPTDK